MKNTLAPLAAISAGALLLSSCTAGDSEPAPTVTTTETVTVTPEPEPEPEPESSEDTAAEEVDDADSDSSDDDWGSVGDTVVSYGAEVTFHDAYLADTIPWHGDSGHQARAAQPLEAESGQWFVMETTVNNAGSGSMDLTCSWPIDIAVVDAQEREFDSISSLYQYEGNPGCNDNLQPGFETDMTYVFSVPDGVEMLGAAFRDTEEAGWGEYAAFIFDPVID